MQGFQDWAQPVTVKAGKWSAEVAAEERCRKDQPSRFEDEPDQFR